MPIATKGAVKSLAPEELKKLGAELILGNTYHLWLRPGLDIIKKAGGLHKFMNWPGPILTDSGGYQVFSLGEKVARQNNGQSFVKITAEGVHFRDPLNGKKYFLTPEKSIDIQLALGSDIIMVLDECPPFPCTYEQVKKAVERTTDWARRCKQHFKRKVNKIPKGKRPLLFCIIQGGIYKDLRVKSTKELLGIGFSAQGGPASGWDGYAIGGVAVGEPRKYLKTVLNATLPLLPEDKPRYLMGLGRPEEIVAAVKAGIDMFDCVIPTREARHGRIYISKTSKNLPKSKTYHTLEYGKKRQTGFYKSIQITNSRFAKDFSPLDKNCGCYACQNFSRAYLNHLFKTGEPLALRLATIHNLHFYLSLMRSLQK